MPVQLDGSVPAIKVKPQNILILAPDGMSHTQPLPSLPKLPLRTRERLLKAYADTAADTQANYICYRRRWR